MLVSVPSCLKLKRELCPLCYFVREGIQKHKHTPGKTEDYYLKYLKHWGRNCVAKRKQRKERKEVKQPNEVKLVSYATRHHSYSYVIWNMVGQYELAEAEPYYYLPFYHGTNNDPNKLDDLLDIVRWWATLDWKEEFERWLRLELFFLEGEWDEYFMMDESPELFERVKDEETGLYVPS